MSEEIGFIISGGYPVNVEQKLKELTPYDRHLMQQPFLQDFMPRTGPVTEGYIDAFKMALEYWLSVERELREIWRNSTEREKE